MAIARDPETVSLSSQLTYVEHFCMSSSQSSSLVAQLLKNPPATQETPVRFLGWEDPLEQGQATHSSILGLPWWLSWSKIHLQCGRLGFNPWVGKSPQRRSSPGEDLLEKSFLENSCPLQYSGLENSMDCTVLVVAKSQTQLSNFQFHFLINLLNPQSDPMRQAPLLQKRKLKLSHTEITYLPAKSHLSQGVFEDSNACLSVVVEVEYNQLGLKKR